MDRSLWFLLWLRLYGWLRRFGRQLRSVKGAGFVLVAICVFVPWVLSGRMTARAATPADLEKFQRFGPLWLLGYSLLTLLFSSGERAIAFNPAEVSLLFSGPFRRRQLVLYKVIVSASNALFAGLVLTAITSRNAESVVAAYVGIVLALIFLQLVSMNAALLIAVAGELPTATQRWLLVLGVVGIAALAVSIASDPSAGTWVDRLEHSTAIGIILTPFRWFVAAFLAHRMWPDLILAAAPALAVDVLLVLMVFALDVKYVEIAAAVSDRVYARLEKMRRGGSVGVAFSTPETASWSLSSLPWWGGIGPLVWRQALTAVRSLGRLLPIVLIFGLMLVPLLSPEAKLDAANTALLLGVTIVGFSIFLTPLTPFDFRGDVDRMDELKMLPIPAWRLVAGQLAIPVVLLSLTQVLALALIQVAQRQPRLELGLMAAFVFPFNLLLFEIENGLFLLFPTRLFASPGDLQAMGRQILRWTAQCFCLGVGVTLAALAGLLTYLITGGALVLSFAVAWLIVTGFGISLLPLLALAFERFDVSRDTPP